MQLCGLLAVVGESPFELLVRTCAGDVLVLPEAAVEIVHVHTESPLFGQFLGELDGETERIVKSEDLLPVKGLAGRVAFCHLVEPAEPFSERQMEFLLLGRHVRKYRILVPLELRISAPVLGDHDPADPAHVRAVGAKLRKVSAGPSDEPSEDVSLSDLGRNHSVAHYERRSPDMVGDYAERPLVFGVLLTCKVFYRPYDPGEELRVVNGLPTVHYPEDSLQSHACIDVLLFQGSELSVRVLEVFHEDVVPDLGELAAVAGWAASGAALRPAVVEEDLGVRSARTGLARGPPPVVGTSVEVYLLLGDAQFVPDLCSLLVPGDRPLAFESGHRYLIDPQLEDVDQKIIAECY